MKHTSKLSIFNLLNSVPLPFYLMLLKMKVLNIAALLATASVGFAGLFPYDAPEVGMSMNTQYSHFSSVVQKYRDRTVDIERRHKTEEVRSVPTTPEPPIVTYSLPDGKQDPNSSSPVPLFGRLPTDQVEGFITITLTKPLAITENGTIRITETEVVVAGTMYQSTITHINEVGKTVTEVVRHTTTNEVTGRSTIPYQVVTTLETRYETVVNAHTEYIVTHIETVTQTTNLGGPTDSSDIRTIPEGFSDVGTSTNKGDEMMTPSSCCGDTSLDTNCPVSGLPLSDDEKTMIDVIFKSGIDGTTYAQWLVNYASQLLAQVDELASYAMIDHTGQYTCAFDFINISGILGLASAAPMYDCFLSSLWAEALRNPSAYAKGDIPTQDEKTKLIVLFERRSDSNGDYNLAELLFDETDNLLAEMKSVIAGQPLDLEMLNGGHLLAVALNAPIATEGLNDAILSAINSYLSTKRLDTLEYLSTTDELPSATGSGDVPTPGFPVVTFVTESGITTSSSSSAVTTTTD